MSITEYSNVFKKWTFGSLKETFREHIRPTRIENITGSCLDPVYAHYLHSNEDFLMNVPLAKVRTMGFLGFTCTSSGGHPFVDTLMEYEQGRCVSYEGSALQRHYETVQPRTAAALLGLPPTGLSEKLASLTALQAVAPWWPDRGKISPEGIEQHQQKRTLEENRENGADLCAADGVSLWGPVSDRKGRLEYNRLITILKSIRINGYKRSDARHGDISGTLFQSYENDYIVNISAGQHRVAALAALGYEEIPVRFSRTFFARTVRREDAANWPFVRNGLFTETQARLVFDRIMTGRTSRSEDDATDLCMFRRRNEDMPLAG